MDKSEKDEIRNMIDFGGDKNSDNEKTIKIPEIKNAPLKEAENENNDKTDDTEQGAVNEAAYSEELIDDDFLSEDFLLEAIPEFAEAGEKTDSEEDLADTGDEESDYKKTDYAEDDFEDIVSDSSDNEENGTDGDNIGYGVKKTVSLRKKFIFRCITAAVILAAVLVFIFTNSGFIGAYKTNFYHNFCRIFNIPISQNNEQQGLEEVKPSEETQEDTEKTEETAKKKDKVKKSKKNNHKEIKYNTNEKASVIIPYENAETSDFKKYRDGIICASSNMMKYVNADGKVEWERATSVVDPILNTAGKYIFLAQKGGTKICLYEGEKLIYDTDAKSNIFNADISANGDAVLVTDREMYKGTVEAYNKKGDCVYLWSSGDLNVMDAAMSPSSRDIAAVMINTDGSVSSTVKLFNIEKEGAKSETKFDNTLLFDVEYFGDEANAFGDNSMVSVNGKGKVIYNITFENAPVVHYAYDDNGNKLVCAELNNIPTLMLFNKGGSQKASAAVDEIPSFLAINAKKVIYNSDRSLFLGKIGASKLSRYNAGMDIKYLIMINKNTFFVVYSNSIQLVKM